MKYADQVYSFPDHPDADENGYISFESQDEKDIFIKGLPSCPKCDDPSKESHSFNTRQHGIKTKAYVTGETKKAFRFKKWKKR